MLNITVYGAGYVGLVTAVCLAEIGHQVVCMDNNMEKIAYLNQAQLPFHEPELESLIYKNIKCARLEFTTDINHAANVAKYQIIAVGTPADADGNADLSSIYQVAQQIVQYCKDNIIVVIKSTVPVGTSDDVFQYIAQKLTDLQKTIQFDVISNPEFLREGTAVNDFLSADRIIIGGSNPVSIELLQQLYQPLITKGIPFIVMERCSAELTKYAANAMLATKISLMNELSHIAEFTGADIEKVRQGISYDKRIGSHYISAGCGFGGSCLPKDLSALYHMGLQQHHQSQLIAAVTAVNQSQKKLLFTKIHDYYSGQLAQKTMAIWGLAFKPDTDDMREASSIELVNSLSQFSVTLQVYDPVAMQNAKSNFCHIPTISYAENKEEALVNADCLIIITEWNEFKQASLNDICSRLKYPVIFDGRNIFRLHEINHQSLDYISIGRRPLLNFKDLE